MEKINNNNEKKGKLTLAQKAGLGLAVMAGGFMGDDPAQIASAQTTTTPTTVSVAASSTKSEMEIEKKRVLIKVLKAFADEFNKGVDLGGAEGDNIIVAAYRQAQIDSKNDNEIMAGIDRYIDGRFTSMENGIAARAQQDVRTTEARTKILNDFRTAIAKVDKATSRNDVLAIMTEAIKKAHAAKNEALSKGIISNSDRAYIELEIYDAQDNAKDFMNSKWMTPQQILDAEAAQKQAERDWLDAKATARVLEVSSRIPLEDGNQRIINNFIREAHKADEIDNPALRNIKLKIAHQNALNACQNDRIKGQITAQIITDLYNDEITPSEIAPFRSGAQIKPHSGGVNAGMQDLDRQR